MNQDLIAATLLALLKESDEIDFFSKEYFFDEKHSEHRSRTVIFGGKCVRRSRLSLLIRDGMTDERRKNIFTSCFDLGSMEVIPADQCTYVELADHIYKKGRNSIAANDAFQTIKESIHRITGKKMQDHFKVDISKALKVIKTLDRLMKKRSTSLMQLLHLPISPKESSLSFRDSFPYVKNQEQVWLIADLKAYLSAELIEKNFDEIGITFSVLHALMINISTNVERILTKAYRSDYALAISAYDELSKATKEFHFEHIVKDLPLDEELFIHLHRLEFAHFAIGYPQLVTKGVPDCIVRPVIRELRTLANAAFPSLYITVSEVDARISISDIPVFSLRWQKDIIAIMEKAMSVTVTLKEFNQITSDAQNLLSNSYWFSVDTDAQHEVTEQVSVWHVVAAFCSVWHNIKHPTKFEPYWKSQKRQGDSIRSAIQVSPFEIPFTVDSVPEEHRHIWLSRLDWFADALRGHTELRDRRISFRFALLQKVHEICSSNNTDSIVHGLANFTDYVKGRALRYHVSH